VFLPSRQTQFRKLKHSCPSLLAVLRGSLRDKAFSTHWTWSGRCHETTSHTRHRMPVSILPPKVNRRDSPFHCFPQTQFRNSATHDSNFDTFSHLVMDYAMV
jgi:hypothetical protein